MSSETPKDDFIELGSTGLNRTGGIIDQEWLRQLKGSRAYQTYTEMRDNDAVIGAVLYAIESLIRQVEWTVKPAEDTDESRRAAAFLESCLLDMDVTWETFISEVLSMLPYGYSLFEVVYKIRGGDQDDVRYKSRYSDGRIGWRKFAMRGQDTIEKWSFTEDGTINGAYQVAAPDYSEKFIPADKSLLFRTKVERNNPEGRSLLRNAYRSWYFLKRLQEIEAIGVERDLAGLPVMHVPIEVMSPSATAAQKSLRSNLEQVIQQIRRDEREGVVMPSELDRDGKPTGYKLSLLSTGGSRSLNTDEIIRRYESRIAMSVLAEFIMLGLDKAGSFALADSKTGLFATSLRSILETIASVVNRSAIAKLFEMNPEFHEHCWPELTYGDIETQDVEKLGRYIQSLSAAGLITPDPNLEDALREIASLPVSAEDSEDEAYGSNDFTSDTSPSSGIGGVEAEDVANDEVEQPDKRSIPLDAAAVDAVLKVLTAISEGKLTRAQARGVLSTAYPQISDSQLDEVLGQELA
jgi:hypothetical protein